MLVLPTAFTYDLSLLFMTPAPIGPSLTASESLLLTSSHLQLVSNTVTIVTMFSFPSLCTLQPPWSKPQSTLARSSTQPPSCHPSLSWTLLVNDHIVVIFVKRKPLYCQ